MQANRQEVDGSNIPNVVLTFVNRIQTWSSVIYKSHMTKKTTFRDASQTYFHTVWTRITKSMYEKTIFTRGSIDMRENFDT